MEGPLSVAVLVVLAVGSSTLAVATVLLVTESIESFVITFSPQKIP
jgi:hypothetical protein